jgi:hypothetical protein
MRQLPESFGGVNFKIAFNLQIEVPSVRLLGHAPEAVKNHFTPIECLTSNIFFSIPKKPPSETWLG